MCGIIGIIGKESVASSLLEGLKRLEYRGYDSAGIATIENGEISRRRAQGKLVNLNARLREDPLDGSIGIGHTRWATHGIPNEANAHPHATQRVALVHNGIIENFLSLRTELLGAGHVLSSDTDTEVMVHLIDQYLGQGMSAKDATAMTLKSLRGAFALGIIFADKPNFMIAARQGSPLAIGVGDGEMFLGSDAIALAPFTRTVIFLEDGDCAILTDESYTIFDQMGEPVNREARRMEWSKASLDKGGYPHFMLKEIYEQPQAIGETLHSYINPTNRTVNLPSLPFDPNGIKSLTLIACGTSYYACLIAKYWLETIARIPTEVDIASEFRYREAPLSRDGATLVVSQSGETIDTLAALRYARSQGQNIISIVNVLESAIARESDTVLQTNAGPEIGVASTKAFTTQLTVLACLVVFLAKTRNAINQSKAAELIDALIGVPAQILETLDQNKNLARISEDIAKACDVLYIGRGTSYPLALEGALKLKEISYIHAEGYAAGEMKHGPIALIDEMVPVIVVAPTDKLIDKTVSNVQEVLARGGNVIYISDLEGIKQLGKEIPSTIIIPTANPFVTPLLYAIPVQLLAYHTAAIKGTDIDQPRNLAKSVTVE